MHDHGLLAKIKSGHRAALGSAPWFVNFVEAAVVSVVSLFLISYIGFWFVLFASRRNNSLQHVLFLNSFIGTFLFAVRKFNEGSRKLKSFIFLSCGSILELSLNAVPRPTTRAERTTDRLMFKFIKSESVHVAQHILKKNKDGNQIFILFLLIKIKKGFNFQSVLRT